MLNSYLASIAARTVRPEPTVRPRLRARFEPRPLARAGVTEPSDLPVSTSSVPADPSEGRVARLESPPRRIAVSQPTQSHVPSRPRSFEPVTRSGESEAALAPRVARQNVEPRRPVTVRPQEPNQKTTRRTPAAAAQTTQLQRPAHSHSEPVIAPAATTRTEKSRAPRSEALAVKPLPARLDQQEEGEHMRPHYSSRRFRSAPDDGNRLQPLLERDRHTETEPTTIVVREKVAPSAALNTQVPASARQPALVSAEREERESEVRSATLFQARPALPDDLLPAPPVSHQFNEPEQPTVHVTIGRIEVRAVSAAQSPAKSPAAVPVMNLDDYLKRRSQGGR